MKNRRVIAFRSVVASLAAINCVSAIAANETPKEPTLQEHGQSFTVMAGPIEFVSLTPLNGGDGQQSQNVASLEAVDMITLSRNGVLSSANRDKLSVGDTIHSGTIVSVGALSILVDSNDKEIVLQPGEGVVVVDKMLAAESCKACTDLVVGTCGANNVKSVTCGADGACAFTCFAPAKPE